MMETLKARREPDLRYARHGYSQVALYRPGQALPVAVFPFHYESKPRRWQETAMVNCVRYGLEWIPDLIGPPVDVGLMKWRAMGFGKDRRAS
jgi:hypothetical protein